MRFWQFDFPDILPSGSVGLCITLLMALAALALARYQRCRLKIVPGGFVAALFVILLCDWLTRPYNLFQAPQIRGELLILSLGAGFLLRTRSTSWVWALPILTACTLLLLFFQESNGRLLFSDDHATFFYRLQLLKENFPNIPFYSPLWNAGKDMRDFFATGSLNVFLIFSPLIYLLPLARTYNWIVASSLFVLLPFAMFSAAKVLRLRGSAPAIAATLALCSNLMWYRWGLKYGTMGFVVSASLLPLVLALSTRALTYRSALSWKEVGALVACTALMLCWSPAGIALLPLVAVAIWRSPKLLYRRDLWISLLLIVAITLPWMSLFWSVSKVSTFLSSHRASTSIGVPSMTSPAPSDNAVLADREAENESVSLKDSSSSRSFRTRGGALDLRRSLSVVRECAIGMNPLVFMLALPGMLLLRRQSRIIITLCAVWLFVIGAICVPLWPQLELDRMLLILALVACLPASVALHSLFEKLSPNEPWWRWVLASFAGGALLTGPFTVFAVVQNRTWEQYYFAEPIVTQIAHAIKKFGGNGRTLFSGFVLHDLNHGHLAPLALTAGKPLMASTYVHNLWRYQQIFPREFITRGPDGIREYLNLHNVTGVIAHEPYWRKYFSARPQEFQLVWEQAPFQLFERLEVSSNYFLEGDGKIITQASNGVRFSLATPEAILKFNWFPFITIENEQTGKQACSLERSEVGSNLTFIKLTGCPLDTPLFLHSRSPWTRLWESRL